MLSTRYARPCAAALLFLLGTSASHAQINPFRGARQGQGLDKADVNMLSDTAVQLNDASPLRVGDTKNWSNPDSGNSGVVKLVRIFKSRGMACHALRYDLSFKQRRAGQSYTFDWCRTGAGWKIKS